MLFNLNASLKNVEMKTSKRGNVYYTLTLVQASSPEEYFICMIDRDVLVDGLPVSVDSLGFYNGKSIFVDLEYKPKYKSFKIIGIS